MDSAIANELDETEEDSQRINAKVISYEEKTASEKKAFLKKIEYEAQCEVQELAHLLESEREIKDQIETEALERERDSFLEQMDSAIANELDETEEDSQGIRN